MLSHALINHIVLRKAVLFLVASSNRAINLLARAELHLSVNTATASATSHNVAHWQATSAAPHHPQPHLSLGTFKSTSTPLQLFRNQFQ